MKQLHRPEPCLVLLERDGSVSVVRWRDRPWSVVKTLETWIWDSEWWTSSDLVGDSRVYHRLATKRGDIEIYRHKTGWYVSSWWD